tara:strand:- start:328 stop:489 length:162 start_codon:yes stop_codon:yes gene_type:complete
VVVQDAHVAEYMFQNTVLKAVTKDVEFVAEAATVTNIRTNQWIPTRECPWEKF